MDGIPDAAGDQSVNDSTVSSNVTQIGSADRVYIGGDPTWLPLPGRGVHACPARAEQAAADGHGCSSAAIRRWRSWSRPCAEGQG